MTHPAFQDGSFAHLPLGALPSRRDPRQLQLSTYLPTLPAIPANADLTVAVPSWPMYGNDRLGDCTVAAVGHLIQAWTAANQKSVVPQDALIEEMYWLTGQPSATTGTPGSPTDDGRVITDVLGAWRNVGITPGDPDKIDAWVSIEPKNLPYVRAGIYLFGGVYLGLSLPITAQTQSQVWDVTDPSLQGNAAPGSWGGHAVPHLAYAVGGHFKVVTWGGIIEMTEAFHTAYVDEAYAIISPDWFTAGKTPQGFDMAALTADLATLGGQAPPPPPPPPPPGPTGADVQATLTAAVHELFQTQVGYVGWLERVRGALYDPNDGSSTHWGKAMRLIDRAYEEAGKL